MNITLWESIKQFAANCDIISKSEQLFSQPGAATGQSKHYPGTPLKESTLEDSWPRSRVSRSLFSSHIAQVRPFFIPLMIVRLAKSYQIHGASWKNTLTVKDLYREQCISMHSRGSAVPASSIYMAKTSPNNGCNSFPPISHALVFPGAMNNFVLLP